MCLASYCLVISLLKIESFYPSYSWNHKCWILKSGVIFIAECAVSLQLRTIYFVEHFTCMNVYNFINRWSNETCIEQSWLRMHLLIKFTWNISNRCTFQNSSWMFTRVFLSVCYILFSLTGLSTLSVSSLYYVCLLVSYFIISVHT